MPDSSRLEALEIKCAHLEDALQSLSDVVYRQQQELDRATTLNGQLAAQVEQLAERVGETGSNEEIPPHY